MDKVGEDQCRRCLDTVSSSVTFTLDMSKTRSDRPAKIDGNGQQPGQRYLRQFESQQIDGSPETIC